jgi:ribonuclease HII
MMNAGPQDAESSGLLDGPDLTPAGHRDVAPVADSAGSAASTPRTAPEERPRSEDAYCPGQPGTDGSRYAEPAMPYEPPTHRVERSIRATTGAKIVAGIDEVGRGAWAGPVTVCAAVTGLRQPPEGLTDSKLLTVKRRTALAEVLNGWVSAHALGHSSPEEIDELGMTAALRLAAVRALEDLPVQPDAVILDGNYDYLGMPWRVRTVIKGDQSCVSVAAASVLAKVRRDALMAELGADHADFAFHDNAGYPSPVHKTALRTLGPTPYHRLSWAFMDALPRWQHLKRTRVAPAEQDAAVEQMGFF